MQTNKATVESTGQPTATESGGRTGTERRSSQRRDYPYYQAIAPRQGSLMPLPRDFVEVRCVDISAGGMAFYLDAAPDYDSLVVALGAAPNVTHFTARVIRVQEATLDGKAAYLVGCRFTGRVYL